MRMSRRRRATVGALTCGCGRAAVVEAVTGGLMDFEGFKKRPVELPDSMIKGISGPATGRGSRLSCAKAQKPLRLRMSVLVTRGESNFTERAVVLTGAHLSDKTFYRSGQYAGRGGLLFHPRSFSACQALPAALSSFPDAGPADPHSRRISSLTSPPAVLATPPSAATAGPPAAASSGQIPLPRPVRAAFRPAAFRPATCHAVAGFSPCSLTGTCLPYPPGQRS